MLGVDDLDVWFGGGRDRVDAVRGASFTVKRGCQLWFGRRKWIRKINYPTRDYGTDPGVVWRNCR